MKKILVFVDHDIVIRHFLNNDTFAHLEKTFELKYVVTANNKRVTAGVRELSVNRGVEVAPYDPKRLALYRQLYRASLMRLVRKNKAFKDTKEVWRVIVGEREIAKSTVRSLPLIYELYKSLMIRRIGRDRPLENLIRRENPDMILHPTVLEGVFVSDLISMGKAMGIPTVYLMNSWDNPSTKALMVGYPDWLVVWGEQTRKHAEQFLGMPSDRVVPLGSAQFEAYRFQPKISAEEFKRSLDVSPDDHLILFAGSGAGRGSDEIKQIQILDEAIDQGALGNSHILFRPHPWHGSRAKEPDFYECGFRHVSMDPSSEEGYRKERESLNPGINFKADYSYANTVINASSVVISGISTMMLEALMLGKPTVCSVFQNDMRRDPFLKRVATMYHFREFLSKTSVVRCNSEEDFVQECQKLLQLAGNQSFAEKLKNEASFFVDWTDIPYGERLSAFIKNLI